VATSPRRREAQPPGHLLALRAHQGNVHGLLLNEYLEALKDHPLTERSQFARWTAVRDGRTVEFDYMVDSIAKRQKTRHDLIERYAWAIPSDEIIATIAALSPIVEVGAGNGYWAYLLAKAGADVVAYDRQPDGGNAWFPKIEKPWFPVQRGPASAAKAHADRTLLIVWPPYNAPMANTALRLYHGSRFVYVGEGDGGCNANSAFFARLEREWRVAAEATIPRWEGINDGVVVYERKL